MRALGQEGARTHEVSVIAIDFDVCTLIQLATHKWTTQ